MHFHMHWLTEVNNHYALCAGAVSNFHKRISRTSYPLHSESEWKHELYLMWFHLICRKLLRLIRLRAKLSQIFLRHDWPELSTSQGPSRHLYLLNLLATLLRLSPWFTLKKKTIFNNDNVLSYRSRLRSHCSCILPFKLHYCLIVWQ